MSFWSEAHLDLQDALNSTIWTESPKVQERIQPYGSTWSFGCIGAQQAMREARKLPWVPDVVGVEWRSPAALLIVGSAYGPFLGGPSLPGQISPEHYVRDGLSGFQRQFLNKVIATRPYYARVADLASNVVPDARRIALFDLCRVSFVEYAQNRERGGDRVVRLAPNLYQQYVEHGDQQNWLWERIEGSNANSVVALGVIAEHGLLRLFSSRLHHVRIHDSVEVDIVFRPSENVKWAQRHAHRLRRFQDRLAMPAPPFWVVTGITDAGVTRTWHVGTVAHPTGAWGSWRSLNNATVRAIYGVGRQ